MLIHTIKVLLVTSCGLGIPASYAQETTLDINEVKQEETKDLPKQEKKVEKIQVTGSHIKRVDVEGPSPLQIIDQEQLQQTGYNSVADVLRDTTVNSFGSVRERSGTNTAGTATVNLRGLGSASTLVLMNGKRMPVDGVSGAVDLNLVPMAAVERIEILKDGASAIYGSDALGGVVNIITKKNYSGTEIRLQQSTPQLVGGRKQEVSITNGFNSGKFNMTNVGHFRKNEVIFSRDRFWNATGESTLGSPGSYQPVNGGTAGDWIADQNCPSGQIQSTPQGDFCTYNFATRSTDLPGLEQTSLMSDMTYAISDLTEVSLRIGGSRKEAQWAYAPAPGIFTIPSSVADGLGLPGVAPGSDVNFRYRLTELGDRVSEITTDSYNVHMGMTTALGDTWELDVNAGQNRIVRIDRGVSGYALTNILDARIADGSFDPSAPEGLRGNIDAARYVPEQLTTSELATVNLSASGEIFEMPSGPAALAVGAQYTQQAYRDQFDQASVNGEVFGNAGSSGGGSRQTQSAFTELSIPVTQGLELQVAGRYDNYSDFGDTVNPKVAARLQASDSLMFRASWGTGFQAPIMQDLYAASSLGFPTFIDQVACNAERQAGGATPSCNPLQYQVESSGNTGLEEERTNSVNVGMVYQPNRVFNFGTDLWMTQMNNVVGIDYEELTQAELNGVDPADFGVIVTRDSNGYIDNIQAPLQNLSSRDIAGIDITTGFRWKKFSLGIDHSQMFYFRQEGFPGAGKQDFLGRNGRPPWRNVVSLGVRPIDRHKTFVAARTIAGHEKSVRTAGSLDSYTEVDLQHTWTPRNFGEIRFGVQNVFGATPPLDDSDINNQLNTQLYSQIGRQYYINYAKGF